MAEWYDDPKFDSDGGTKARAKLKKSVSDRRAKKNAVKVSAKDTGIMDRPDAKSVIDTKEKLKDPITAIASAFTGG